MKPYCTKELRDHVFSTYPVLSEKDSYRKLFQYLLFGTFCDEETGKLVLAKHQVLAGMVGKSPEDRHWSAYDFLLSFKQNVLPRFTWTESDSWHVKSRQLKTTGFDKTTNELLQKDLLIDPKLATEEIVYFDDGTKYNKTNRAKRAKEAAKQNDYQARFAELNPTQQLISGVMNQIDTSLYASKIQPNWIKIKNQLDQLEEEKQVQQMKIILALRDNPPIEYLPSKLENSPRLYAGFDSPCALKSEVRQALCGGWTEIDLAASQFTILANLLKSEPALAFCASGKKLWSYLKEYCTGNPDYTTEDKKHLKSIVYGICFGSTKETLNAKMTGRWYPLRKNDILIDLIQKRDNWHWLIKKYGYITDVWNQRQELVPDEYDWITHEDGRQTRTLIKKNRDYKSLAACQIQSIEMEIISAIFEQAKLDSANYKYQITLFQHDGATIAFYEKSLQERAINRLQEAITTKALSLPTPIEHMRLDIKNLPKTTKEELERYKKDKSERDHERKKL